jgi:hypothetical protein
VTFLGLILDPCKAILNEILPEGIACVAIQAIESGQAGVEKSWWGINRIGQHFTRALAEFPGVAEGQIPATSRRRHKMLGTRIDFCKREYSTLVRPIVSCFTRTLHRSDLQSGSGAIRLVVHTRPCICPFALMMLGGRPNSKELSIFPSHHVSFVTEQIHPRCGQTCGGSGCGTSR